MIIERYNVLNWTLSSSTTVTGYTLSRDGIAIATLGGDVTSYTDHNQSEKSIVYSLVAFDDQGNKSSAVQLTLSRS